MFLATAVATALAASGPAPSEASQSVVSSEDAEARPSAKESIHVSGALLAGAGWNDHYGPGIGGRVGVHVPLLGTQPALGVYGGIGLVYHSDQQDPPPGSSRLEGWLVELTAEAGAHVQVPLVVIRPYLGVGMLRTSETQCDDDGCDQDDAAHPMLTPGILLVSSPTAPWAPVFVGADGRFVVSSRSELNTFSVLGTIGVSL